MRFSMHVIEWQHACISVLRICLIVSLLIQNRVWHASFLSIGEIKYLHAPLWANNWYTFPYAYSIVCLIMLHCSILLHCVYLTLHFDFMSSMCNVSYYSLVSFFYCHYMFRPNCHHQVYRLLWWRNLLLTVIFFCFYYVVASDYC
jgi:hypothetical protein